MATIREKIIIINKLGLHARAAAKFVALASRFSSDVEVAKQDRVINGKSIMGIMMLAASKGSELELIISGEDEVEARDALITLINDRFGEES